MSVSCPSSHEILATPLSVHYLSAVQMSREVFLCDRTNVIVIGLLSWTPPGGASAVDDSKLALTNRRSRTTIEFSHFNLSSALSAYNVRLYGERDVLVTSTDSVSVKLWGLAYGSMMCRYAVLVVQRFGVGLVIERSLVRLPAGAISSQLGQLSLPSLRSR